MKISYSWLKEYLDIDVPAKDLAEKIERGSVEIDSVEKPSDGLKKKLWWAKSCPWNRTLIQTT